jgi:hypothetical protein
MLVLQAIQVRWNSFYNLLVKYGINICNEIKKYIELSNEERIKKLESEDKDTNLDYKFKMILHDYKSFPELWDFVKD